VLAAIATWRREFSLEAPRVLFERLAVASRFDTADVMFLKRALQRELPKPVRASITAELFADLVSADEEAFARELYGDLDEWRSMAAAGMDIGGHGYHHECLTSLNAADRTEELDRTAEFVAMVRNGRSDSWSMSYPHGSYDDAIVALAVERGANIGFANRGGVADDLTDLMRLPRLDTKDLPTNPDAPPPTR
jgi:hypothetical protein